MTTTTTPSRVEGHDVGAVAVKAPTLAWAIRRTLLAIVILLVSIAGAAFLLYASIDPGEEGWPSCGAAGARGPLPRQAPAPTSSFRGSQGTPRAMVARPGLRGVAPQIASLCSQFPKMH